RVAMDYGLTGLPPISQSFLEKLLALRLLTHAEATQFLTEQRDRLFELFGEYELGQALVQAGLLTDFQLDRVLAGNGHGLVLGNYRIRGQVGSGGMGLVYRAEHILMKREVAVKGLPLDEDCPPSVRPRLYTQMRIPAQFPHPPLVPRPHARQNPPSGPPS